MFFLHSDGELDKHMEALIALRKKYDDNILLDDFHNGSSRVKSLKFLSILKLSRRIFDITCELQNREVTKIHQRRRLILKGEKKRK